MKKTKILVTLLMLIAIVSSLVACGTNGTKVKGTFKFDEVETTVYGDATYEIPYHWTLELDKDAYSLTMVCDIGAGFSTVYSYDGKFTIADGTKDNVVLGTPSAMWQPTYVQEADGSFVEDTSIEPVAVEGEDFDRMTATISGQTWVVNTENGTMTRLEK